MNTAIKSILLVDDDLDDQQFFYEALKVAGKNTALYTAKDGIDAIDTLNHLTPDIIMLDLNMPRMSGIEFLRELKKSKQFGHIPVIIYSSFLSTFDQNEMYALGAKQFIKKQISFDETVNSIKPLFTETAAGFYTPLNVFPVNSLNPQC
jgi:CheY-like chemotaxis protein